MRIACSHCGSTYAFDAGLIPPKGYDARCTSCQGVFFVHPDGAQNANAMGGDGAPGAGPDASAKGDASATADDAGPTFAPASLHRGTMELDADLHEASGVAQKFVAAQPTPAAAKRRTLSIDDDLELGPRMGRGRRTQNDGPEPAHLHKPWARRGLFLGVALVAVIGSGVVVGVVCSKRLHAPPSVQPPIHIVRAPDPIAAEAFGRGVKALWDDTPTGYLAAAKAFEAACARDPEFTDAWAGAAIAALLRSADLAAEAVQATRVSQEQARRALAEVAQHAGGGQLADLTEAQTEAQEGDDTAQDDGSSDGHDALAAGRGPARDGASAARLMRLNKAQAAIVQASQERALALHQEAHALQRRGASQLLHGERLMTQTPLMALALAMWYTDDAQMAPLARQQLRAFEQLMGGDCAPIETDPNSCIDSNPTAQKPSATGLSDKMAEAPYGFLAFWIEARLIAQQSGAASPQATAAVTAYERALALQPGLRRARWELAQYELRLGHLDVARPLLEDLAHGTPPHDKARAELQRLVRAGTGGTP